VVTAIVEITIVPFIYLREYCYHVGDSSFDLRGAVERLSPIGRETDVASERTLLFCTVAMGHAFHECLLMDHVWNSHQAIDPYDSV